MTETERFVYQLCEKTFLSLWSFPNPIGKKGKELCDILVVCEPDIIIFSVKEILIKSSGDFETDENRWLERAINESVKQIYGAERYIKNTNCILLNDRKTSIDLPKNVNWIFHRVAVTFGRGKKFSLNYGDFGKGFVHVFDEKSVKIILKELDTISDFIHYITEIESFIKNKQYPFSYGEEDVLAYYLLNGFSLPKEADLVIFHDDLYKGLKTNKNYKKIISDLKVSYKWDQIIESLIKDFNDSTLINTVSREELELAIRQMAREDRNSRKLLSEQFFDFIGVNHAPKAKARVIYSQKNHNVVYLFVLGDHTDRLTRIRELQLRSVVIRKLYNCTTIIGIGTDKYSPKGYALDFTYTYFPELTEILSQQADEIIEELGYFKKSIQRKI